MSEIARPWIEQYESGVPAEINPDQYKSINELIDGAIAKFKDRTAYHHMGRNVTYGEFNDLIEKFASFLLNDLRLIKGDRVAVMMPNCIQHPISVFGTLRAGLTVVNVNPLYTPRELHHQLSDSGAKAIVIMENFCDTLSKSLDGTKIKQVITTQIGDMHSFFKRHMMNFVVKYVKKMIPPHKLENTIPFLDALKRGVKPLVRNEVAPSDLAFLQYTGGTTGLAKGAMLTHRNLIANMVQSLAWIGHHAQAGKEIIVTALPLYHIFALTANGLTFFELGATSLLITNPRDLKGFVKELSKHRFTIFTGVNTLFNALLNTPGFDRLNFSAFKFSLGGGMAVQRSVAERWKKTTGSTLSEAYGLTETSPAVCMNPLGNQEYNASIGLPLPSTDICIKDDNGKILPMDGVASGEICIKGPQVMAGYWQKPEETAKVMDEDGWLHTGDIGKIDPTGYAYVVDRKKDMILVSGFNVYPNEIEDVLSMMPEIAEVAAIGIPHEYSGEVVKVFIVKKDPNLTKEDVINFAKENLTGYKRPKEIEFREELPKTNVGKILRRQLKQPQSS